MGQLLYLFKHCQKKEHDKVRFLAAIQGIDLDKETKETKKSNSDKTTSEGFTFKDPKEYEKLSPEEREKLTQEMMKNLSGFVANPIKSLTGRGKH